MAQICIRRQWHAPFDQHILLRTHPPQVFPLMCGRELDQVILALAVGEYEVGRDEVDLRVDGTIIAQREREVKRDVVDRTPQVDDLKAVAEEFRRLLRRQVPVHARSGRGSGLVYVHLRDGLTLVGRVAVLSRPVPADRW